jgi:hypothetical protein
MNVRLKCQRSIWPIYGGHSVRVTLLCHTVILACSGENISHTPAHTVLSESIPTPWLIPHFVVLQPESSHPSTHNTAQWPHNNKTCFIENEIQKYLIYINIHTSLLWHSKLSSGDSNFLWSSLRCHLIGVHLWPIQLIGHDLERNIPDYIRSHGWQSEQKLYHEVQGTVCRSLRYNCDEAYIWGRVENNF